MFNNEAFPTVVEGDLLATVELGTDGSSVWTIWYFVEDAFWGHSQWLN